jgi:hypothetical protein
VSQRTALSHVDRTARFSHGEDDAWVVTCPNAFPQAGPDHFGTVIETELRRLVGFS